MPLGPPVTAPIEAIAEHGELAAIAEWRGGVGAGGRDEPDRAPISGRAPAPNRPDS